jgi:hypothetical protein
MPQLRRRADSPLVATHAGVLSRLRYSTRAPRGRLPGRVVYVQRRCFGVAVCTGVSRVLWLTWPSPPWTLLQYSGIVLMVLAPFLFFPFSKTLFLAFDLLFRPATPEELS